MKTRPRRRLGTLTVCAVLAGVTLAAPLGQALAAATESSRTQTTVTSDRHSITVDDRIRYAGYAPRETIPVAIEYSASYNVVFRGLTLFRSIPFAPPRIVTGEVTNVRGTPAPGNPAATGIVTFDLRFNTLNKTATGESGLARLELVLGLDTDCDLATGDQDGIDRSRTIRVEITVSTGSD